MTEAGDVVVDANLLVAVSSGDSRGDVVAAQIIDWQKGGVSLHAPQLLPFEIASALTMLVTSGGLDSGEVSEVWNDLQALPLVLHPMASVPRVVEIARSLRRTSAYDAPYIALAEALDSTLWTLDGRLARNAAQAGFNVHLLATEAPP